MNLIEILENSILLEAVKINNGKEAYELIKNNKLGVKIHPSYNTVDNDNSEFIFILDKIVNKAASNDKVFAVQLFLNKIPANQMLTFADRDYIFKAISYRNKPWAKEFPGYKEFISLNNKELTYKDLTKLVEGLEEEAQKHGHGDKKEVKTLYDDGTWTLQIPLSFKGAKAISFYGKRGEQQIPTEWCTRADLEWYNRYTRKYHLHVIRNWKTGNSYQMAYDGNTIDFLDQRDVKGDKISKGDLTTLPNEMLSKFEFAKEFNLVDYKEKYNNAAKDKKAILDKTTDPNEARWGKEEKLIENVCRKKWLNWGNGNPLNAYQRTKNISMRRDPGQSMFKYYFKDDPKIFITNNIDEETEVWYTYPNGRIVGIYDIDDSDKRDEVEDIGETLDYYANQYNGTSKREEREDNQHDYFNGSSISETYIERELQNDKEFKKSLGEFLTKKLNKKVGVYEIELGGSISPGAIMPSALNIETKIGDDVVNLGFNNPDKNHLKYSLMHGKTFENMGFSDSVRNELDNIVSAEIKKIAKILIKNKRLKGIRQMHKRNDPAREYETGTKRMYFENYFPY